MDLSSGGSMSHRAKCMVVLETIIEPTEAFLLLQQGEKVQSAVVTLTEIFKKGRPDEGRLVQSLIRQEKQPPVVHALVRQERPPVPTLVHSLVRQERPPVPTLMRHAEQDEIMSPHQEKPPRPVTNLAPRGPPPARRKPTQGPPPLHPPASARKRPYNNDLVQNKSSSNDEDDIDWFFDKPHIPTPQAVDALQLQFKRFIDPPIEQVWRMQRLPPENWNAKRIKVKQGRPSKG